MELELKFQAKRDYRPIIKDMGFVFKKSQHQKDSYYLVDEKINEVRTWLRVREDVMNHKSSVDLHKLMSKYATEETEVAIPADEAFKMKDIIEWLGFLPRCVVDKKREVYVKEDIKITLDTVAGLGDFIEIEIQGDENTVNIEKINALAAELELDTSCNMEGYPEMLMRRQNPM